MKKALCTLALASVVGFAGAAFAAGPAFEQVDRDKDGKISKAEAAVVKTLDFAKADVDKDGMLDRAEYEAAVS